MNLYLDWGEGREETIPIIGRLLGQNIFSKDATSIRGRSLAGRRGVIKHGTMDPQNQSRIFYRGVIKLSSRAELISLLNTSMFGPDNNLNN